MHLGMGTNNFAELCTTKHIIHFALSHHCRHLQLFGDSNIVCNWLNNASHCNAYTLRHIIGEAHRMIDIFDSFVCHHIYREQNSEADQLSKEEMHLQDNVWLIQEEIDGTHHQYYHRPFIEQGQFGQ